MQNMLDTNKVLFSFNIEKNVKDEFIKIVNKDDQNAAQVLRKFIKEYIKNNK